MRLFHVSPSSEQKFLGLFRDKNTTAKEAGYIESLSQGAADEVEGAVFKATASSAGGPVPSSDSSAAAAAVPGQNDRPQTDCGLDFSGEDGVYRAKPIVIYDTDDSVAQPQGDIFAPVPSSQAFCYPPEEGNGSGLLAFSAVGGTPVEVSGQRDEEHGPPSVDSRVMAEGARQTSPRMSDSSLSWSPERSLLSSPDDQHQVKAPTQEGPPSPVESHSARLKRQKEEVRRSPLKTCHPRVLPRESTSPQMVPGSPLRTFPINIDPQNLEDRRRGLTPLLRGRSPFQQAEQAALADTKNISDSPAALHPRKVSQKSLPSLARSRIPQDYQHYLGPHGRAFVPSFNQEQLAFADGSDPTEVVPSGVQGMADYQEASAPVVSPLKRTSSSRSMENLTFQPGNCFSKIKELGLDTGDSSGSQSAALLCTSTVLTTEASPLCA